MSDPRAALQSLAESCLVRIAGRESDGGAGSGVWVSQDTILTCAHVVPNGIGSAVDVVWEGHSLVGVVSEHSPNLSPPGEVWSYPDLAIITVDEPVEHPCAWLVETDVVPGAQLIAIGHSTQLQGKLSPAVVQGRYSGHHTFGRGKLWQFKSNEIRGGMSGGPVLDPATGAVCALVKLTLDEERDRGGYLVPVGALRELAPQRRATMLLDSDEFHYRDPRWSTLRKQVAALQERRLALLDADEEAEFLGLIAHFRHLDEPELLMIYGACAPNRRRPDVRLDTLRDVLFALLDTGGPEDGLLPVLRLAHRLYEHFGRSQDLRDWATAVAARRDRVAELKEIRATADARPAGVVTVEIVPGYAEVDRYRLVVTVTDDDGSRRIHADPSAVHTISGIRNILSRHLAFALGTLGSATLVEFVVPPALFDEPFEELSPIRPYTNLGRSHRVVLRDLDRQDDPHTRASWTSRWQRLNDGGGEIRWTSCAERSTQSEFAARLENDPDAAVLVFSRRPSSTPSSIGLLTVAIEAGVPAIAWRRDTCSEHDGGGEHEICSGQRFREALCAELQARPLESVPAVVQTLRREAATHHPRAAAAVCCGVVLVWDDPARAVPAAGILSEPPTP